LCPGGWLRRIGSTGEIQHGLKEVLLAGKFVLVVLQELLACLGIYLDNLRQGLVSFYFPMLVAPEDIVFRFL
jgi:hypothetical protein